MHLALEVRELITHSVDEEGREELVWIYGANSHDLVVKMLDVHDHCTNGRASVDTNVESLFNEV